MNEIMDLILMLSREIKIIHDILQCRPRSAQERFKEEWIDGQDVMMLLHISQRTLQTLRDNKTLPFSRINGKFYYKVSDLEELLDQNYSHAKARSHETR